MNINFLLQALRILHAGIYDDTEIRMIYDYLRGLDQEMLTMFSESRSIISYENDLHFCIEIINIMLYILETNEEYEKCQILKDKKDESMDIIKLKREKHECI